MTPPTATHVRAKCSHACSHEPGKPKKEAVVRSGTWTRLDPWYGFPLGSDGPRLDSNGVKLKLRSAEAANLAVV